MRNAILIITCSLLGLHLLKAQDVSVIAAENDKGAFPVVYKNVAATIVLDTTDYEVVKIAAADLANDIFSISGAKPSRITQIIKSPMILVGTLGKSRPVDELIKNAKIDVSGLKGQWEKFMITVVNLPGSKTGRALLVIGSDRRGTAFGIYELSKQLGVSPWYWWADVPVKKSKSLFVKDTTQVFGPPSVQYRGIFLNDEKNGLGPWARKNYDAKTGTMGPATYAKIYELMLRLKANVIWPAMKGPESFYQVAGNKEMADRYAILVGTSHHEPLGVNSSIDWDEKTDGPWQYETNAAALKAIMDKRVAETAKYDNVFTLGLRGNADVAMESKGGLDDRVKLMETIFKDQRDIISKYHTKPLDQIPQVFTAYKEVLQILNNGLKVPDDVMLVWPDDNYGFIQQLNSDQQKKRSGGSGVYYHLNYVGRPMSAMWLSAPSPGLIRKELNKAYGNGANRIWIFNVGDIKPYEYLTSYCLDMAWKFNYNDADFTDRYMSKWLTQTFGDGLAGKIKPLLNEYYQTSFERKPEFMGWDRNEPVTPVVNTEYSLNNYEEFDRRLAKLNNLGNEVKQLSKTIPANLSNTFYQLIYYPIVCADLNNKKFLYAQKNRIYADRGWASADQYARLSRTALDSLKLLTANYSNLLNGKWKYMMQIQPGSPSVLPPLTSLNLREKAVMDIGYSGNTPVKGQSINEALPCFNKLFNEKYTIGVFDKGKQPFKWTALASAPWIKLSQTYGNCTEEDELQVSIDWQTIPAGENLTGRVVISGAGTQREIGVHVFHPQIRLKGRFVEEDGAIAINASNYTRKNDWKDYQWQTLDHLGITGKVMCISRDTLPRTSFEWDFEKNAPSLEYDFYTYNQGWVDVLAYTLPTHAISLQRGCLYGISIDDQPPKIIDFTTGDRNEEWKVNVERNAAIKSSRHFINRPGNHTLKVWLIDTDVCFDKFVINTGGVRASYLGPLETVISNK